METVLITGGTGMIGTVLGQALLKKGYQVIVLSRAGEKRPVTPGLSYALWDVEKQEIDKEALGKADYIIHLAGANVAGKRWTKKRKAVILNSRVQSGRLLVKSLREIPHHVKAFISASAIGWYGPDPVIPNPRPFVETDPNSDDFLGNTCRQWEESVQPLAAARIRLVKLRTGIVLAEKGGALQEFKKPLRFGIAAILGSGKQIISWIHIDDLVDMYIAAIENEKFAGAYNAVAPQPVSNKELTIQLAKSRKKFYISVKVPSFLLKLVIGEMSVEVLKSTTVSADRIQQNGFVFKYGDIKTALADLNS